MSIGAFVLFAGIVFVASVIQGISGFAFGMVVLMVFPYLFGYTKSLVLASLMATFFLEATPKKEEYLGTTQIICVITLVLDIALRALNGMFTADLIGYTFIGAVFMVAGLLIARRLVRHMDALTMRRFICLVVMVDGVVMLFH